RCRAGRNDRPRCLLAHPQAEDVRADGAQRGQEHQEDRRRAPALELRQSRAHRKETDPLSAAPGTEKIRVKIMAKEKKTTEGAPSTTLHRNTSPLGGSFMFPPTVIDDIHIKSELGRYR